MVDVPPDSGSKPNPDAAGVGAAAGAPRWVKITGLAVGSLLVLFVVLRLAGVGAQHGPGQHTPDGQSPATVTQEHTPPGDSHR